ncbi:DUF2306 domain-containing protein [Agromyces tardus]|uniref:DUF2306 domain-containing protein n=2 Tax=Agromyces tardus TaxID=2583849 RepID=A0A3M8AMT8_9MICO|nr:DUF2306 domain-containing protein [Agromyces tardus]
MPIPAASGPGPGSAARTPRSRRRPEWLVPAGLIALSLVPMAAGAFRLTDLATATTVTPDNARFFAAPVPIILHIVGASLFLLLGALQFAPSLRRHRWHRLAGRVAAPAGLVGALSGMWMAVFSDLPASNGTALMVMRLVFGAAMAGGIVAAFVAIRRGDVRTHSAWMTRAYAIGLGAGTQVFTFLPWTLVYGAPDVATHAVLMGAGWVINLAVAEVVIRRRTRRSPRRTGATPRTESAAARARLS